jgi:leucyl aminopeptidase
MKLEFKLVGKKTSSTLVVALVAASKKSDAKLKNKPSDGKSASSTKVQALTSNAEIKKIVEKLSASKFINGKCGEFYVDRDALGEDQHLATLGLGDKLDAESFRRAGSFISKLVKSANVKEATLLVGSVPKNVAAPIWSQAFAEGAHLGAYSFTELKSERKAEETAVIHVSAEGNSKAVTTGFATGEILGECINFSRRLGDIPGNLMTPPILAEEVQKAAKGTGLKVTVWDKARIKKEKMGCLLGVSLGSEIEPRFIIMEYNGAAKSKNPVCFVGKGLTFDSGGISIKPAAGMEEMKFDMCGGANTIGTMLAIAKLKLKVNVIGFVPSSENMPGPMANKPGDITVARNGKTVEVNNTDAEGRLILADALSYATELKPSFIVDSATLTGAMVIALGDTHTGYFSKNEKISKAMELAAEKAGERIWRLPLIEEHKDDMKGTYADLNNISSNKGAGSAHGAAFLENFVDLEIPWVHVDIAGTAWNTGHRLPYNPKRGASGCMIRTYVELAKAWG